MAVEEVANDLDLVPRTPKELLEDVVDELRRPWATGVSAAFLAAAAMCAFVAARSAAEHALLASVCAGIQTAGTVAVFMLAGASTAWDTANEVAAGNVNIYVLTSLAVFGTVLLGCALEGALLLVLFGAAHLVEDELTDRAQANVKALWDSVPTEAWVLPRSALDESGAGAAADAPGSASAYSDDSDAEGEAELLGVDVGTARLRRAEEVLVGELLLVRAGQQVPLDATVVRGTAMVSVAHLTGEELPIQAAAGDEVAAGAQNLDGVLVLQAVRPSEDSMPARIARLTDKAQRRAPRLQTLIQRFGDVYSKAVLGATALFITAAPLVLGVPLVGADAGSGAIYRAFGFLTAAAPCALFMAPLVYVVALGRCARNGVLVHNARTLEALADAKTFLMDKTGTLTTGQLVCIGVERLEDALARERSAGAVAGVDADMLLKRELFQPSTSAERRALAVAEAFEHAASHPIARAVVHCHASAQAASRRSGTRLPRVQLGSFKQVHGRGVEGTAVLVGEGEPSEEISVVLGSLDHVAAKCVNADNAAGIRRLAAQVDSTHVTIAMRASVGGSSSSGGQQDVAGTDVIEDVTLMYFADTVRASSREAVSKLKEAAWGGESCDVAMVTGDRRENAVAVGATVGIPESHVHAGLLPEDKLARVEEARAKGVCVMVGDGINDAPALAAADVGIAVSHTPSEASAAAADIVLLRSDASVLPNLVQLSSRMKAILKQNLVLAAVSIAGAALPALSGFVPLWGAVLMHEGATLMVAINSLRLLPRSSFATIKAEAKQWLVANKLAIGAILSLASLMFTAVLGWEAVGTAAIASASVSLVSGLLAGGLHTLTGPDHLAALMPLSVGVGRAQSFLLGALWGLGHDTGQIIFGCAFILLRSHMHFDLAMLSQYGTLAVAATLVIIGATGLWERMSGGHHHHHDHDDEIEVGDKKGFRKLFAVYSTGVLHGLQPDALVVIMPAFAMPTLNAICFLGAFLLGTIFAMGTYTAFIAKSVDIVAKTNGQRGVDRIAYLSSSISLVVGLLLGLGAVLGIDIL